MYMNKDNYLENKRTIFDLDDDGVEYTKHTIGFLLYIVIFVILIPYLLIKHNYFNILSAYFPNLDLIATILGYHGGPLNSSIWTHLYNPVDSTVTGYLTSNIINLFALLGVTYIIAYYTFITKNINKGWSRIFIMLPMTYFIPSNIIVYIMDMIGNYLNPFLLNESLLHYLIVVIFGLIIAVGFILVESKLIDVLVPYIVKLLTKLV